MGVSCLAIPWPVFTAIYIQQGSQKYQHVATISWGDTLPANHPSRGMYTYTYTYTYRYRYTYIYIYICVCVYMYIYIYTHIHVCARVCVCVCVRCLAHRFGTFKEKSKRPLAPGLPSQP